MTRISASSAVSSYIPLWRRSLNVSSPSWLHLTLSAALMDTSEEPFMDSDHILLITRSSVSSPVLFKVGVQGNEKWFVSNENMCSPFVFSRCTAPSRDLDGHRCLHRSRAHTDMLVREFELGTLWDEYGIIGDIIVSNVLPCSYIINIYLWTHFSAIHERLSSSRYTRTSLTRSAASGD